MQGGGQLWIRGDLPEGAHSGQAEITADRVVAAQSVIASALDVERGQVQTAGTRRPEQEVPQRVHNQGIHGLRRIGGHVAQDRVDAADRGYDLRIEEGFGQIHVVDLDEGFVEDADIGPDLRVTEAVGGRGEGVADAGVDTRVVSLVRRQPMTEQGRDEFIHRDALELGGDPTAGLLVEAFVIPIWVLGRHAGGLGIVLPEEHGVQRGETGLFIGPHVSGHDQRGRGQSQRVVVGLRAVIQRQQFANGGGTALEAAARESAQPRGPIGGAAVDVGGVDEGANAIDLLPG